MGTKQTDTFLKVREMLKTISTLSYPDETNTGDQITSQLTLVNMQFLKSLQKCEKKSDGRPSIHLEALAALVGIMAYKHLFV